MIRILLVALLAMIVAACQSEETVAEQPDWRSMSEAELKEVCGAQGGTPARGLGGWTCAMPEPDAGKACTNSKECSGWCLAESRTCSPVRPYFGCHQLYENGQIQALCVD